jgi:hypothetical protein
MTESDREKNKIFELKDARITRMSVLKTMSGVSMDTLLTVAAKIVNGQENIPTVQRVLEAARELAEGAFSIAKDLGLKNTELAEVLERWVQDARPPEAKPNEPVSAEKPAETEKVEAEKPSVKIIETIFQETPSAVSDDVAKEIETLMEKDKVCAGVIIETNAVIGAVNATLTGIKIGEQWLNLDENTVLDVDLAAVKATKKIDRQEMYIKYVTGNSGENGKVLSVALPSPLSKAA